MLFNKRFTPAKAITRGIVLILKVQNIFKVKYSAQNKTSHRTISRCHNRTHFMRTAVLAIVDDGTEVFWNADLIPIMLSARQRWELLAMTMPPRLILFNDTNESDVRLVNSMARAKSFFCNQHQSARTRSSLIIVRRRPTNVMIQQLL